MMRLVQRNVGVQWRIFAGIANEDDELAGIDSPLVGCLIPVAEGARVEIESDVLRFAGSEADLFKAFEFAFGTLCFC